MDYHMQSDVFTSRDISHQNLYAGLTFHACLASLVQDLNLVIGDDL